jgi:hypothetical protein
MKLLLANESDCCFFKFWLQDRVHQGINYQGELFVQFHSFSPHRRQQAYDLGSRLLDRGLSVLITCSQQRYVLGITLHGNSLQIGDAEKQKFFSEIQDLETAFSKLSHNNRVK